MYRLVDHVVHRTEAGAEAEAAFAAIYHDHAPAVYGLVRRICGPSLAPDVTQDVFVRLWTQPDLFDPERGSLRSFLLATAAGRAVDVVRSESARNRREHRRSRSVRPHAPENDERLLEQERRARIAGAISALPAHERDAIVSAFYGEVTYVEAASTLAVAEGTFKSRVRSGLVKLRRSVGDLASQAPVGAEGRIPT